MRFGDLSITAQSTEVIVKGEPGWRFGGWFWIRESGDYDFWEGLTEGAIRGDGRVEFDGFVGERAVFATLDKAVFDCLVYTTPLASRLSGNRLTASGSIPVECSSPFVGALPTQVVPSADRY